MNRGIESANHVKPRGKVRGPPVVLAHGIGLGAWIWERDQEILADAGLESWALTLPGHGDDATDDVGMECVEQALEDAVNALEQPVALVGHSMGGLAGQVVAARRELASLTLISPVPPANVTPLPTREGIRSAVGQLPALARGLDLNPPHSDYEWNSFHLLSPEERDCCTARLVPWPNRMVRDLVRRRPEIARDSIRCPVLVTFGRLDRTFQNNTYRLVADLYTALNWRFDDLAHIPMVEPGGERHAKKVADWIRHPLRRRINEIDAFAPDEGVGESAREQRRGFVRRRTRIE